ncbi:hypothetical protein QFZ22_000205 [Streptomyces canus]|uniref:Transposase n=1 Tax=Streptomyces canus TaxID=58343 RepID=A0AAW8F543_9ACTN|nr:DUF6262 family protein [Streptomyces canus]MDQ0904220.1 hypothetical protein [Streptomyces canus]
MHLAPVAAENSGEDASASVMELNAGAGTCSRASVPGQTAAAVAARRRQTERKLTDVDAAIAQLRRERGRLTVRGIAARAAVSATFLYENPDARARVQAAIADSKSRHDRATAAEHEAIEATWRERALNAEAELTRAQKEIFVQRQRLGELMGHLRDLSQTAPGESTRDHRLLQERLEGAHGGDHRRNGDGRHLRCQGPGLADSPSAANSRAHLAPPIGDGFPSPRSRQSSQSSSTSAVASSQRSPRRHK